MATIGNYIINTSGKIKRVLIENKDWYISGSKAQKVQYMMLFQAYQCRILGVCFYRTCSNDNQRLSKIIGIKVNNI